ncbi:unnamed protein product [Timema podura]|uniref:Pre-mRNA-splicing factor SPF27 n=1 Tax=Timema podura TaxID=61482 RepID=A0ABN7P022_TIMPD|nr:unnamed protein product [Timema podura]
MAGEVVVDALPYIDQGYDEPGVREATEIMRSEFERMQQRLPMDVLSMKRYELPPPPAGSANLELMVEYGCEAWKSYLEVLVQLVTQAQKQLTTMRKQIQEINWQRKNMQTQGGEKLRNLESSWVGLVRFMS